MSARKSLPRISAAQSNRLSIQSHQSQVSGVLDPDSYVGSNDEENPLWFKELENHSITSRLSTRFSGAVTDTPVLNPDSEPDSTLIDKSWWKNVENTPDVGRGTDNVHGTYKERNVEARRIVDHSDTSLVDEVIAKNRSAARLSQVTSLHKNQFMELFELTDNTVLSEKDPRDAHNRDEYDQQRKTKLESSDTSLTDEILPKKRPFLRLKKRKSLHQDIFSAILETAEDSTASKNTVENFGDEKRQRNKSLSQSSDTSLSDQIVSKKKPPLHRKQRNSLQQDVFSGILESPKNFSPSRSDVANVGDEEKQRNKSLSESFDTSSTGEIVAKKRPAPLLKKRKYNQQNLFSDILEPSNDSIHIEKNVQDAGNVEEQQNRSELKTSDIPSGEGGATKKRSASHFDNEQSFRRDIFSEISESSRDSARLEEIDQNAQNESNLEASDISLMGEKPALRHKRRKTFKRHEFLGKSSKDSSNSKPDVQGSQRSLTSSSMSDISLEKPRKPVFKKKKGKLVRRSTNVDTKSDEESSPDVFKDALDTSKSVRDTRPVEATNSSPLSSAPTNEHSSENLVENFDESDETLHLAVDVDGSLSPTILTNSKKQPMFTKNTGRTSPNFHNLLQAPNSDAETYHWPSSDRNSESDQDTPLSPNLASQNVPPVDEDDSDTEEIIKKQRVPLIRRKRESKQKKMFFELLDATNNSIQSGQVGDREQSEEIVSPEHHISSSHTKRRFSTNKNDHGEISGSPNIEVEENRSNVIDESRHERQPTDEENDDSDISKTSNDELKENEAEIATTRLSNSRRSRESIQNRKSENQSRIDEELKTPHRRKNKSASNKLSMSRGKGDDKRASGPVIVSIEKVSPSQFKLRNPSNNPNATGARKSIELSDIDGAINQSSSKRQSANRENDYSDISRSPNDESETNGSKISLTPRSRKSHDSIQSKKSLNESRYNVERPNNEEKVESLKVDAKSARKHSSESSNEEVVENYSGQSEQRSRSTPDLEVEVNRSEVADISNSEEESTDQENDNLDLPSISIDDEVFENTSNDAAPRESESLKNRHNSIKDQPQLNEDQLRNESQTVRNESISKEGSVPNDEGEDREEEVSDRAENFYNRPAMIDETQQPKKSSRNKKSQSGDKIGDNHTKTTTFLSVSNRSIDKSKSRDIKSTKPLQENTSSRVIERRSFFNTSGTANRTIGKAQREITQPGTVEQPNVSFDTDKMTQIKSALDKVRSKELATMKNSKIDSYFKQVSVNKAVVPDVDSLKILSKTQSTKNKKKTATKITDKAYLVNGKIYHRPNLPRPKHWATNRLYNFLWTHLEPKYKLRTRVRSEKFVLELGEAVALITRRKKYDNYKKELDTLIRQMAHLNIIKTRYEFHIFCQTYLPYEFRIKVIPMLLPGNVRNIPFSPEKLHTPILDI